MTKTEIIKELYTNGTENYKISKGAAAEMLDKIIEIITNGLVNDGEVQITGFLKLKTRHVEGHEGHNPRNPQEKIYIKPKNQISFSAGAKLKEAINAKL